MECSRVEQGHCTHAVRLPPLQLVGLCLCGGSCSLRVLGALRDTWSRVPQTRPRLVQQQLLLLQLPGLTPRTRR